MMTFKQRTLTLIAIGVMTMSPALVTSVAADTRASDTELPLCKPVPKLLHYEVLDDDRESRVAHQGEVHLTFTIDQTGRVRDVSISSSTDDWFNDLSIQSVLRWRYQPPRQTCRSKTTIRYALKK